MPHCSENNHGHGYPAVPLPGPDPVEAKGCINATHAEANALAFAARQGISTDGATCYLTLSPCLNCARLLIAAGIKRVVWTTTYRDMAGSELLEQAGVEKYVMLPDELYAS